MASDQHNSATAPEDLFHEAEYSSDAAKPKRKAEWKSTIDSIAHHGIAFEIFNHGVVIIGKSGVGKSELGLELIDRGHRLICDDLVAGHLIDKKIQISAPLEFGVGFMEIRGIGFVNIKKFYGSHVVCTRQTLSLVIELVKHETLDLINQNRLLQLIDEIEVLGIKVPRYKLPIGANRNLPILVELIVKYAIARENGYDSHAEFINQQAQAIEEGED